MKNTILELETKMTQQQVKMSHYYEYYKGNHDILKEYRKTNGSNVIEVHNYCKMFINNNTGFLLGNPIHLKVEEIEAMDIDEKNLVDVYHETVGTYIQQIDQKLMKYQQIFGYTFELNYINKRGEFAVEVVSPLKMAVNRVGNKVVHGLLYKGMIGNVKYYDFFDVLNGTIYPITIDNQVVTAIDKGIRNPIRNPIIVVNNNHESQSEMEDIITLNDAYNQVSSDLTNEISDHRHSYLHIAGAKITEEILKQMNASGIITTPENSKVAFLTKNINDAFVQNKLEQLHTQIYNLAGQVDFNDSNIGSNTSSLALRNKLTNLINKLKLKEGFIREAVLLRVRNLAEYQSVKSVGVSYDYNTVKVEFTPNIPTSDYEVAKMVIELYDAGLLSKETAISELPIVNNTRNELRKIDEERETNSMSELLGDALKQMSDVRDE